MASNHDFTASPCSDREQGTLCDTRHATISLPNYRVGRGTPTQSYVDSESPLVPSTVRADSPLLVAVLALDVESRVLLEVVFLQIEQQQGEPEREKKTASCCIWSTEVFDCLFHTLGGPLGSPHFSLPCPRWNPSQHRCTVGTHTTVSNWEIKFMTALLSSPWECSCHCPLMVHARLLCPYPAITLRPTLTSVLVTPTSQ